jgi:hypothetical protein
MSHPYDAVTKYLFERWRADWVSLAGRVVMAEVEAVDADLSTVTTGADRVLRVHDIPPWICHVEFQSSRDVTLPDRTHVYNALLNSLAGSEI